jgi:flagellar protein FlaG
MNVGPSGIDPARPARLQLPARVPRALPASAVFAEALRHHDARGRVDAIPASPPPGLRAEILAAQRVIGELEARGRERYFELTDGRVRIEVRDLDGNVLKEIPPSRALEIAAGKEVE